MQVVKEKSEMKMWKRTLHYNWRKGGGGNARLRRMSLDSDVR